MTLNKSLYISLEHLKKAVYKLHLAEHLLEVTYPLVKDPKMLQSVLSSLEQTHQNIFESIIPSSLANADTSFIMKLNSFEDILASSMVLDKGIIKTIKTVDELTTQHKESAVVFSRKDSFVICDDDYNIKKIDPLLVGEQLHNTKKLTSRMIDLLKENTDKE